MAKLWSNNSVIILSTSLTYAADASVRHKGLVTATILPKTGATNQIAAFSIKIAWDEEKI